MIKNPVITVIAAVVLLLAAACGAYWLGYTDGQRNGNSDKKVVHQLGTPRISCKLKVYVYSGETVDELPEGFEPDAFVSREEESVASRAGAPVYVSESDPYSVFTPVRQGEGYSLFVTEPLCYNLVMLGGSLYRGFGVEERIEPEFFDESEYRCIGVIGNIVRYKLPENDLGSNINGAGRVFAGEDSDTIYVRVDEFDVHHYLRLQKTW